MPPVRPDRSNDISEAQGQQQAPEGKQEGGLRSVMSWLFSCFLFSTSEPPVATKSLGDRKVVDLTRKKDNRTNYDEKFKAKYQEYKTAKIEVPSDLKVTLIEGERTTIWDKIRTGLITESKTKELDDKLTKLEEYLETEVPLKKEREKIKEACLEGIEKILKLPIADKVKDKYKVYKSRLDNNLEDKKNFLDAVKLQVECTIALAELKEVVLSEDIEQKYITYQEGGQLPIKLKVLEELKNQIKIDKEGGAPIQEYCQGAVKKLLSTDLSDSDRAKYTGVKSKLEEGSYSIQQLQGVKLDLREELKKAAIRPGCLLMVDAVLSKVDSEKEKKYYEDVKKIIQNKKCTISDIMGYQKEAKRVLEDQALTKACNIMVAKIIQKETIPKSKKYYTKIQEELNKGQYKDLKSIENSLLEKLERISLKENCQKRIEGLLKEKPNLAKNEEFQGIKEKLEKNSLSMDQLKNFQASIGIVENKVQKERIKVLHQEVLAGIQDVFPSLSSSDQKTVNEYKERIMRPGIGEESLQEIKDWIQEKKDRLQVEKTTSFTSKDLEKKRDDLLPKLEEAVKREGLSSQEKGLLDKEIKRLAPGQELTSRILDGAERSLNLIKFNHDKNPPEA